MILVERCWEKGELASLSSEMVIYKPSRSFAQKNGKKIEGLLKVHSALIASTCISRIERKNGFELAERKCEVRKQNRNEL